MVGIKESNLIYMSTKRTKGAHYAHASVDIRYTFPFGSKELWGIANRTDYDLKAHSHASGKDLAYFDPLTNQKIIPYA